jgi:hypothetical protein
MRRTLLLIALVTASFGLGSYQVLGELTLYSGANLLIAAVAGGAAALAGLVALSRASQPTLRGPLLRILGATSLTCAIAIGVFVAADRSGIRLDWTFEGTFELSEATLGLLGRLPGPLAATLYYDSGDPRIRNTRLLLDEMARGHDMKVRVREIEQYPDEEDRYGIGSSNSVLLQLEGDWWLVERPSEGGLYEGLARLVHPRNTVLYIGVGAGEGDLERGDDLGYSGLRAALEAEGYEVRPLPLVAVPEVPPDAAAVLMIAPRRALTANALTALRSYLERGGRVAAFLEPDNESGLEQLLAGYGLASPDAYVIDPASGPVEGAPPGISPIVFNYSQHPVTRGLDRNRMTLFRGARAFELRKPQPNDRLRGVVISSGEAWLAPSRPTPTAGSLLADAPGPSERNYRNLVAVAELPRGGPSPARVLAFGDADLAANRSLRALYNLDLVLNGIHWLTEREDLIALHPKSGGRQLIQFPVPLQRSVQALYGVGLLVPELLLMTGGLLWLRSRSA